MAREFFADLLQVLVISVVTLLIVRWSVAGPIARAAQWMRALRMGRLSFPQEIPDLDVFRPLAREVKTFAQSLSQARSAAQTEARLRDAGESLWTPERLAIHIQGRLEEGKLIVVSNREPYMHVQMVSRSSALCLPADWSQRWSRFCAHAPGPGSRMAAVMRSGNSGPAWIICACLQKIRNYTLRRVWLTKEEEQGTTTDLQMKGCGRSAISLIRVQFFAPRTGRATLKSIKNLRMRWWKRSRIPEPCGAGAGLSFCAFAAAHQNAASGCACGDLLAYSVAESGSVWNLPLAA